MVKEVETWLEDVEVIVIECEEKGDIDAYTLVSVTPLYMEGEDGSASGQRQMLLKEALKINKRQVIKGQKLRDYLNSGVGKSLFD